VKCDRCGKDNPAEIHTCTAMAVRLADDLRQGHFEMATFAADELCRLSAENDALWADAERYRWLRTAEGVPISHQAARDPVLYDAAIDAAIAKATGEAK
jgi:hypothetical protein